MVFPGMENTARIRRRGIPRKIFESLNAIRAHGPSVEQYGRLGVRLGGLPLPRVRHGSTRTISWASGGLNRRANIGSDTRIGAEPQVAKTWGSSNGFQIFVGYEGKEKECTLPGLNLDSTKGKGSGAVRPTSGGESGDLSLRPAWLHLQGNSILGSWDRRNDVGTRDPLWTRGDASNALWLFTCTDPG